MLEGLARFERYHSIHMYTGKSNYMENVYQPHLAEWEFDNVRSEIRRVRRHQGIDHEVKVAYDEWNVWYRARQPEQLEEKYDLSDALAVAAYLNIFVRQCDVVTVAKLAQLVNVIAAVFTSPEGLYLQSIYHPFALMAMHTQEVALATWVESPTVTLPSGLPGQVKPSRAASLGAFNVLDAAATRDEARTTLSVSLINRSEVESMDVALELAAGEVTGETRRFESNGDDVHGINDFDQPKAGAVTETTEQQSGRLLRFQLPPHSHTVLRMGTGS